MPIIQNLSSTILVFFFTRFIYFLSISLLSFLVFFSPSIVFLVLLSKKAIRRNKAFVGRQQLASLPGSTRNSANFSGCLAIWENASTFYVKILSNLLIYRSLKGHSLEFSETWTLSTLQKTSLLIYFPLQKNSEEINIRLT